MLFPIDKYRFMQHIKLEVLDILYVDISNKKPSFFPRNYSLIDSIKIIINHFRTADDFTLVLFCHAYGTILPMQFESTSCGNRI